MKKITFAPHAFDDFDKWDVEHPKVFNRIKELIRDIQQNPFKGIGKSEPLKHQYKGCWSRRITEEHRLIYRVETAAIIIISCKGHYQ